MKGVLSWLVRWACHAGTRDFIPPWLLWSAVQHIFFLVHYFNSCVPIAQQAWQAAVLGRLPLIMCVSGEYSEILYRKKMKNKHKKKY
jgi:hypothetical protein